MTHDWLPRRAGQRGFTIIESIIALVLLAIASVAIVSLQSGIFTGQSESKDMGAGVQLMQECAEQILAARRSGGFAAASLASSSAATTSCNGMTLTGYAAPTVAVTAGNSTTTNMGACPYASGSNCKLVTITQGGLTPITLMLVGP